MRGGCSRDGRRQSRLLRGNKAGFEILTVNHANGGSVRLDATITYKDSGHEVGVYAHDHDEARHALPTSPHPPHTSISHATSAPAPPLPTPPLPAPSPRRPAGGPRQRDLRQGVLALGWRRLLRGRRRRALGRPGPVGPFSEASLNLPAGDDDSLSVDPTEGECVGEEAAAGGLRLHEPCRSLVWASAVGEETVAWWRMSCGRVLGVCDGPQRVGCEGPSWTCPGHVLFRRVRRAAD